MKRVLALILTLLSFSGYAQKTLGPWQPNNSADQYGTHYDIYGVGGYREVRDTVQRDSITALRRSPGMLVYDTTLKIVWQYIGTDGTNGTNNANWKVFGAAIGWGLMTANGYMIIDSSLLTTRKRLDSLYGVISSQITPGGDVSGTITNLTISKLRGYATAATAPTSGQFYHWDGSAWGPYSILAADIPNLDWSKITTGKPTTLAGYGIGDAYTKTNLQTSGQASVHWGNITNTPTTKAGYNLNDVVAYVDTAAIVAAYLKGIYLKFPGVIYNTPTYSIGNKVDTATMTFATQLARYVLAAGSGGGTPSFQALDHNFISDWSSNAVTSLGGSAGALSLSSDLSMVTGTLGLATPSSASGTYKLEVIDVSSGNRRSVILAPFSLTYAASMTVNAANSLNQGVTLTGNTTVTISNMYAGQTLKINFKQDATGGRTVGWSNTIVWPGGVPYSPTSRANASDVVGIYFDGSTLYGLNTLYDVQ